VQRVRDDQPRRERRDEYQQAEPRASDEAPATGCTRGRRPETARRSRRSRSTSEPRRPNGARGRKRTVRSRRRNTTAPVRRAPAETSSPRVSRGVRADTRATAGFRFPTGESRLPATEPSTSTREYEYSAFGVVASRFRDPRSFRVEPEPLNVPAPRTRATIRRSSRGLVEVDHLEHRRRDVCEGASLADRPSSRSAVRSDVNQRNLVVRVRGVGVLLGSPYRRRCRGLR